MARQDKDGFVDPAVVAAWRRMLWLVRGSAEVVEALVPVAAGMTKEEVSRLLARAGAPSGKGVEPVEQVLGLLGVIPRARYEALLREYQTLLQEYEQLGSRVSEAEQNIERLRGVLREQGGVDEAEELLDSWGGLVRRTLRAQAGFVRSIASAAGSAAPSAPPSGAAPLAEPAEAQGEVVAPAGPTEPILAQVPEPETDAPPPTPASTPSRARGAGAATTKRPSSRSRTVRTSSSTSVSGPIPAAADAEPIEAPALAAESEPGAPPAPGLGANTGGRSGWGYQEAHVLRQPVHPHNVRHVGTRPDPCGGGGADRTARARIGTEAAASDHARPGAARGRGDRRNYPEAPVVGQPARANDVEHLWIEPGEAHRLSRARSGPPHGRGRRPYFRRLRYRHPIDVSARPH